MRRARKALGLRQADLARRIGTHTQLIAWLECVQLRFLLRYGEVTLIGHCQDIAHVLGLNLFEVYDPGWLRGPREEDLDAQRWWEAHGHRTEAPDPARTFELKDLRVWLGDRMSGLGYRERQILGLRYGLEGPPQTLREVALTLGVSPERIRQIQGVAEVRLVLQIHHKHQVTSYHLRQLEIVTLADRGYGSRRIARLLGLRPPEVALVMARTRG